MRILHCIPSLVTGGTQRQLSYLAPALADRGNEVHVAYLHAGSNLERLERGAVALHRLRSSGNHDPSIFLQLLALVRRSKPDIVQTWLLQMDILGGVVARIANVPWVISERSAGPTDPGSLKNRTRAQVAGFARAVISNSRGGDAYWQKVNGRIGRHVVPNGLPIEELDRIEPERLPPPDLANGEKVVLFAGRFERGKNIANLVKAVSILRRGMPVRAVLCGDGPLRAEIERLVAEEGLSGIVSLPGFCPDVPARMKGADVFAFMSEFEGFPNAVVEAMACRCPLVVSDIPAHREFLDKRCAVLVDPSSPGKIASALNRTLSDGEGRRARAEAARARALRWTVESMAGEYERIYREILQPGIASGRAGR